MLKIRLQRVGRKHEPSFRLVLTDSKNSTKSGRFKEILGSYDPRKSTEFIKGERVKYWLSKGALATDTVHNFLVSNSILNDKKRNVLPMKSVIIKEKVTEKESVKPFGDKGKMPEEVAEIKETEDATPTIDEPGETPDTSVATEVPRV